MEPTIMTAQLILEAAIGGPAAGRVGVCYS
jgi:hypothetical protein